MTNYNIYVLFSALIVVLSACAVNKQPAQIEYHHSNPSLDSSGTSANESTIPVVHNDGELISSNLDNDDSNNYDQNLEVMKPKNDDENYIVPAPVAQNKEIKKNDIDDAQTQKTIAEVKPAAKPVEIKIEEEPSKQVQQNITNYVNPVEGTVITKFGAKTEYGTNKGINISAPEGTEVVSSTNGRVIYADYDATFGNLVIIKSDNSNMVLSYAHLKDLSVTKGAHLKQGESIGFVGTTGKIKQPQLHFALREGKKAVDPLKFVNY